MKKFLLSLVLLVLLVSCSPASNEAVTPDASVASPAVVTVDMFYTFINVAQAPEELGMSWGMMTNEAQCSAINKCELSNFQTRWWASKAVYKVYSCGSNSVLVEEMLYPRADAAPTEISDPNYWTYSLSDSGGIMMISKISKSKAPGDECILALDRVSNP
jgi:hypothetical protein